MNRPLARSTKSVKHSRQSFSTLTTTRRSSTCPKSWAPNLPARAQRHKYKWPRANTWSAHIKVNSAFVLYKNPWTSTELSTSTRSIKLVMRLMWSQYLTRMKTKTTSSSSALRMQVQAILREVSATLAALKKAKWSMVFWNQLRATVASFKLANKVVCQPSAAFIKSKHLILTLTVWRSASAFKLRS
jgi:hypothetical protein